MWAWRPVVGFLFAIPALAIAISYSKSNSSFADSSSVVFGNPLALRICCPAAARACQRATAAASGGRAHGRPFATSLNLLPGGNSMATYPLRTASKYHRRVTFAIALLLFARILVLAGWYLWAALLLGLGFRHPPLFQQWSRSIRRADWTAVAV